MPTWRSLKDYSPFARVLVTYMWEQRPPLLPSQFAVAMGVRKQQVSSWLTTAVVPDPPLVVHLARQMGMPVRDLLIAAGHATANDPLFDTADAWTYMRQHLAAALRDRQIVDEVASSTVSMGMGDADGQERAEHAERDERDEREDAASRAAHVERLLERLLGTIEALERRQRFAEPQRPLAPTPPSDAPLPVAAERSVPDEDTEDTEDAEDAEDTADDMGGASTAARAEHAATPSTDALPATRARKGA